MADPNGRSIFLFASSSSGDGDDDPDEEGVNGDDSSVNAAASKQSNKEVIERRSNGSERNNDSNNEESSVDNDDSSEEVVERRSNGSERNDDRDNEESSVDDDDSGEDESGDERSSSNGDEGTRTSPSSSNGSSEAPSSLGKRHRRRFSASQKVKLLKLVESKMQSENISWRAAAKHYDINAKQIRDWKKKFSQLNDTTRNKKAKSLCKGRPSILDSMEDDLLRYIFELRERGMGVSLRMVMLKASSLNRDFRERSEVARYNSVRRFVYRHSFRYRMPTHKSQRAPSETQSEAIDWLQTVKSRIRALWEDWMIQQGLQDNSTTPPTRKLIAQWAQTALANISENMIQNAWLHDQYTWFPPTAPPNPTMAAALATIEQQQQQQQQQAVTDQNNEQEEHSK